MNRIALCSVDCWDIQWSLVATLGRCWAACPSGLKMCRIFFTKKNSNDMFKPTVMGIVTEYYSREMIYYNIRYNKHVYHDNYN